MAGPGRRRWFVGYAVMLVATLIVIGGALLVGSGLTAPTNVGGTYAVDQGGAPPDCLGGVIALNQSGSFVTLEPPAAAELPAGATEAEVKAATTSSVGGSLRLEDTTLRGTVTCATGGSTPLEASVDVERQSLSGTVGSEGFSAQHVQPGETTEAAAPLDVEHTLGRLMLAIAVVILAARATGALVAKVGQPRVMGEVLAGILLGPTLLGLVAPGLESYLFPEEIRSLLRGAADIGLVFYMFLVGLELNPSELRGHAEQVAFISHASICLPLAAGLALAVPLFGIVGPSTDFAPYALFMGVAMSITAFPVLARILLERRMLSSPVGTMAIGAAAIDDITAWVLIALASGVAAATMATGDTNIVLELIQVVVLVAAFCVVLGVIGQRGLGRLSVAYDEAGHVPAAWFAGILVGVLFAAYVAVQIGVAGIFGAFVVGLIMPRRAGLTLELTRRIEDFVATVLLPLFFVVAGLNTELGLIRGPLLWSITVGIFVVAVSCKWLGAMWAAKFTGLAWRESAAIGALMNTRGLTELIVLNLGLSRGVLTPALYSMLVIMALGTTFMTGPALRVIDPTGALSTEPEDEVRGAVAQGPAAGPRPDRAVLVAATDPAHVDQLTAIAVPLASATPEREVVLAALLEPSRDTTGFARGQEELATVSERLAARRGRIAEGGLWARSAALVSAHPGQDISKLAAEHQVDVVVMDGRRPLLRPGPVAGPVGEALTDVGCDVAVLVAGPGEMQLDEQRAVAVPFGGDDHDWAALEAAVWIASYYGAPVDLLGAEADAARGVGDASPLLADAALFMQRLADVVIRPRLFTPGPEGLTEVSAGAGLLVLGLSSRWREEGLGEVRTAVATALPAPTLFVRRGMDRGVLVAKPDMEGVAWSRTRGSMPPA